MSLTPPSERIWWKEPIAKIELSWIIIAFVWGLVMFFMMIYWHGAGEQNLSNEAYKITPERFAAKSQAMIDEYTVREENYFPVVHPPAGSDVYLIARLWQWWPTKWKRSGSAPGPVARSDQQSPPPGKTGPRSHPVPPQRPPHPGNAERSSSYAQPPPPKQPAPPSKRANRWPQSDRPESIL